MAGYNSPVNLNLPATPKGVPEEMFGEFRRIYSALNNLAEYLGRVAESIDGFTSNRGVATMVAGTVVVANANVAAGSRIFLTVQVLGTVATPKAVAITARTPGVGFTITSADNTDTSVVAWWFV